MEAERIDTAHSDSANAFWQQTLAERVAQVPDAPCHLVQGRVHRVVGLTIEASGCAAAPGSLCLIAHADTAGILAEVVGFTGHTTFLMPTKQVTGIQPGALVTPLRAHRQYMAGDALLGRVIDGEGQPLDDLGPLQAHDPVTLQAEPINPLRRPTINQPMDVGVRSINALLTMGRGQRVGLFAGSGVGKSMLLGMMTKHTSADVVIVALVGERGREVREFVERSLGPKGLSRAVVVATPSDSSPLMRIHGALLATSLAEYFRDQGKNVLLLMDSLTRFAQAQREIGLSVGEVPVTKGYPPSAFAGIPNLCERAGMGADGRGSITAIYTVLVEGDDHNEPIADAARSVLDGHVVLSRELAAAGIYPAIDIPASASRVLDQVTDQQQRLLISLYRTLQASYSDNQDLINVGAYVAGSNPEIDNAIRLWPALQGFLRQSADDPQSLVIAKEALERLFADNESSNDAPGNG